MECDNKVVFKVNNKKIVIEDELTNINLLRYDDAFTLKYFQEMLRNKELESFGIHEIDVGEVEIVRITKNNEDLQTNNKENEDNSNTFKNDIWAKRGKQTAIDLEATEKLLQLRLKYENKFNDKKTVKVGIWQNIAKEMSEAGYFVGLGKVGGEKCRQKFQNLTKIYITFIKHVNQTGAEKKDPPDNFALLHAILGGKDKIFPKFSIDSFDSPSMYNNIIDNVSTEIDEQSNSDTVEQNIENTVPETEISEIAGSSSSRFKNINKTVKPKTNKLEIIQCIQNVHAENSVRHDLQFNQLINVLNEQNDLLKEQNNERNRLIDLFEIAVKTNSKSKKRRRSSDSD